MSKDFFDHCFDPLAETPEEEGAASQLSLLEELAFDEMNLVELPFCLLKKQTSSCRSVFLSPSGDEYLEATSNRYGLPTALAEPIVLGLMWLTMEQVKFESPKVTFSLRELVEEYIYPGQFTRYRASGRLLKSVEEELHRIAATRLRSNRWYDRSLGKHVEMDAAIIDSMTVRNAGGRNATRILEIVWGNKVFESVRARYTKSLSIQTWLQIRYPLDRRLFRWLDRQLEGKDYQVVTSCQAWARHKMLMQSRNLDRGGRTGSSYVLTKVTEALYRLNGIGFSVQLEADKSPADYVFRFERIPGKQNEVRELDAEAELVAEFKRVFLGSPGKLGRLRKADRKLASVWIASYGLKKALWMVERSKKLHDLGRYSGQRLLWFSGLEPYEMAAAADYERNEV